LPALWFGGRIALLPWTGKVWERVRRSVLVGVVVTNVRAPLRPRFWRRSRRTGDRDGQGVDVNSTDGEGGESDFGEHDDRECRKKEQIITAPGLELEREEKGTGDPYWLA
jgi:hypothetical protein